MKRILTFDKSERKILGKACQVLGIHFEEFVHDAALQAADEVLGLNDEAYRMSGSERGITDMEDQWRGWNGERP